MMLRKFFFVPVVLIVLLGTAAAQSDRAEQTSRFLLLPFDGSSAGKYAYLTDGLRSMLASRLVAKDDVQLVDYAIQETELKKLEATSNGKGDLGTVFSRLQTDYLVSGALYATKNGLKIQIIVTSAESSANPQSFSMVAEDEEQVIPVIGSLSEEIVQKVLHHHSSVTPSGQTATEDGGNNGFLTEHPEKQYRKGLLGGGSIISSDGANASVSAKGMRASSIIPVEIIAIDSGDLDGDGQQEIVFASKTEIQVSRYKEGRFQSIGSYSLRPTFKIHAVTLADLDGDKKLEIYISANERFRVSSLIMSWSTEEGIRTLTENIPWYLRPVSLPGEGTILLGQGGSNDAAKGYLGNGVFRLVVEGKLSSFRRGIRLSLPSSVNLFDFTWADIDGNGVIEIVAIDRNEKLLVYDGQNKLMWVSDQNFGGSQNYIGPSRGEKNTSDSASGAVDLDADRDLSFLPTRLIARDIDDDGKQEIIVGRNKRDSFRFLRNYRTYDGGDIACLSWQNSEMKEVWRTSTVPGYIADYSFFLPPADIQKNERKSVSQLYVGQIPENAFLGFLPTKESKVLIYEFEIPKK